MRPTRKSSTLVKKGQSMLKTKQNFKNDILANQADKVEGTFKPLNMNQNAGMKNNSMHMTNNMNRTFSRQIKNNSLGPRPVTNSNTVNQSRVLKRNSIDQKIDIQRRQEQKQKQSTQAQQKINKTQVRNIAYHSVHQQKVTKSRVFSVVNPEDKTKISNATSRNEARNQMLNTRKSKFQTDSNIKVLKNVKQQQNVNKMKSKNINIHPVKNTNAKKNPKQQQKIQKKEEEKKEIPKKIDEPKVEQSQTKIEVKPQNQRQDNKNQVDPQIQASFGEISPETIRQTVSHIPAHPISQRIRQQSQQSQNSLPSNDLQIEPINITSPIDQPIQNQQVQQARENNTSQSRQITNNVDLQSLITNTQDIINFIDRLNLRTRVQAFDLMVNQLVQLNLIAQQVHELGQIGNNLGYSLVNVFGTRIRELQTTIINQVGIALIASFQQRMDPQFEALVMREPSLRSGFSKDDIEKTFSEQLSLEQVECSICLDNVQPGQRIIQLQCRHEFHPICIKTWLQNSKKCPLCRTEQQRKTP